jgi:quinolinate synthase
MNSSAALKAFCGENGGIVCTSSNAKTVLEWAFERGQRVLFFPDQHLGRNTAKALGVPAGADAHVESPQGSRRQRRAGTAGFPGHPLARILFSAQALQRGADRKGQGRLPRRPGDRPPRMPHGGGGRGRLRRLHRLHQEGHRRGHRAHHVCHRHRNQHGEPARCRIPAAHHLLPGPRDLPLLHHVPDPPGLPGLGPRGAGGRAVVNRITVADSVQDHARTALERMLAARP